MFRFLLLGNVECGLVDGGEGEGKVVEEEEVDVFFTVAGGVW